VQPLLDLLGLDPEVERRCLDEVVDERTHPVQVARFGRADSKPRGAAHARTTTSSLRTAATSTCNVGV
jgi:hypothetical protein